MTRCWRSSRTIGSDTATLLHCRVQMDSSCLLDWPYRVRPNVVVSESLNSIDAVSAADLHRFSALLGLVSPLQDSSAGSLGGGRMPSKKTDRSTPSGCRWSPASKAARSVSDTGQHPEPHQCRLHLSSRRWFRGQEDLSLRHHSCTAETRNHKDLAGRRRDDRVGAT